MYSVLLLSLLSCVPLWLGEQHRNLHMLHFPSSSPSMLWGQGLGEQGKISEWCRKLARVHEAQPTPGHLMESSSTSSFQLYFFLFFITRWASRALGIGQRGHGRTKESCFCTGERVLLKARFVTPKRRLSTPQGTDSPWAADAGNQQWCLFLGLCVWPQTSPSGLLFCLHPTFHLFFERWFSFVTPFMSSLKRWFLIMKSFFRWYN